MLRAKIIMLSVMISIALSGCSENPTSDKSANTEGLADEKSEVLASKQPAMTEKGDNSATDNQSTLIEYTVADAEHSEKCGFKTSEGNILVKAEYDFCGEFHEGMAYLLKQNLTVDADGAYYIGYVNSSGELTIPVDIKADYGLTLDPRNFNEGLVAILKQGKWGFMDKEGKIAIPFNYDSANDFDHDIATVSKNYKYGAIDRSGNTILALKYDYLGEFKDGLATYMSPLASEKRGFVNIKGEPVIEPIWDQVMDFSEGLAAVAKGDYENAKWGFVDTTGKVVIEPQYDHVYIDEGGDSPDVTGGYFNNGTIEVYNNGENEQVTAITIDKNGKALKLKSYASFSDILHEKYN